MEETEIPEKIVSFINNNIENEDNIFYPANFYICKQCDEIPILTINTLTDFEFNCSNNHNEKFKDNFIFNNFFSDNTPICAICKNRNVLFYDESNKKYICRKCFFNNENNEKNSSLKFVNLNDKFNYCREENYEYANFYYCETHKENISAYCSKNNDECKIELINKIENCEIIKLYIKIYYLKKIILDKLEKNDIKKEILEKYKKNIINLINIYETIINTYIINSKNYLFKRNVDIIKKYMANKIIFKFKEVIFEVDFNNDLKNNNIEYKESPIKYEIINKIKKRIYNLEKKGNEDSNMKIDNLKIGHSKKIIPFYHKFGEMIDNNKFIYNIDKCIENIEKNWNKEEIENMKKFFKKCPDYLGFLTKEKSNFISNIKKETILKRLYNTNFISIDNTIDLFILNNNINKDIIPFIELKVEENDSIENKRKKIYKENKKELGNKKDILEPYVISNFNLTWTKIEEFLKTKTLFSCYEKTIKDIYGECGLTDEKNIKDCLDKIINNNIKKIYFVKFPNQLIGLTIFNGEIFINKKYYDLLYNCEQNISSMAVIYITILHEIMHCLIRLFSTENNNCNNHFTNTIDRIQKNNSKIIKESGNLFEKNLTGNLNEFNIYNSSYILDIDNYNVSFEEFQKNLKNYTEKIDKIKSKDGLLSSSNLVIKQGKYFFLESTKLVKKYCRKEIRFIDDDNE